MSDGDPNEPWKLVQHDLGEGPGHVDGDDIADGDTDPFSATTGGAADTFSATTAGDKGEEVSTKIGDVARGYASGFAHFLAEAAGGVWEMPEEAAYAASRDGARGMAEACSRWADPAMTPLGPSDALRHTAWAAMVTLDALEHWEGAQPGPVDVTWVTDRVRALLMVHEHVQGGAHTLASQMDQLNNEVGIRLAVEYFRAHGPGTARADGQGAMCRAAWDALNAGRVWMVAPGGAGVLVDTRGWRDHAGSAWRGLDPDTGRRRR